MTHSRSIALALASTSLAFASAPLLAQDTERMTEAVEAEADTGAFMGAVLVAKGDELLLDRAWGSADLEWDIANTTDTKFRIGSVTKQFTAVSILLLQQRGALDLDAPIATYLEDAPESWAPVTVRHLLRHTSGIPNVTALDEFEDKRRLPISQDEVIAMFSGLPLEFEPSSQFSYSNSGYILLSRIIETISGQSLGDFYRANIFDPLEMEATGLDVSAAILLKRAEGYSPTDDTGLVNAPYADMGIPSGAGALYSTTGDLLKWQRGLFRGHILNEASLAEYVAAGEFDAFADDRYAHGVLVDRTGENRYYWHGGGIEGFTAWLGYDPDRDVTVAVLANRNGGASIKIGQHLMTLAQGAEVELPGDRVTIELPAETLAEYVGVYALSPDFKLTIFLEEDRLMSQATGQSAAQIFPQGDDRFFLTAVDARLAFVRDDEGAITGATLFQNAREFAATKE